IERRFRPRGGMMMGFYLCAYSMGRFWVENLRIDQANQFLGLRLNVWTSLLVFGLGILLIIWCNRKSFDCLEPSSSQAGKDSSGAGKTENAESAGL
ncbi:MAG: prolipoprotein diacylglyceryl transferase family protein, partial [Varibaculum timonense]